MTYAHTSPLFNIQIHVAIYFQLTDTEFQNNCSIQLKDNILLVTTRGSL